MNTKTVSVRISESVLDKVKKHTIKTKQSINGFMDLAALDKIRCDKLNDRIIKAQELIEPDFYPNPSKP